VEFGLKTIQSRRFPVWKTWVKQPTQTQVAQYLAIHLCGQVPRPPTMGRKSGRPWHRV